MSGLRTESLFPLPLTPFEMQMLEDDAEQFPMTFALRVAFSGGFDESAFRQAIPEALLRHPLLNAVVEHRRWRLPRWVPSSRPPTLSVCALNEATDSTLQLMRLDLIKQPGLCVLVETLAAGGTATFHFHHACCDAFGARQFIGDVFAIYGQTTEFVSPPELLPIDVAGLSRRDRVERPMTRTIGTLERWKLLSAAVCRMLYYKPAPLAPGVARDPSADVGIVAKSVVLCATDLSQLRHTLQERRLTISDLLLIEVFRIVRDWNQTFAEIGVNQRIRIMVPVSLRGTEQSQMPATNCVSLVFLSVPLGEILDNVDFERFVAKRLQQLANLRASSWMNRLLRLANRIPGGFARHSSRKKCLATAVATYVGEVTHAFSAKFPQRANRCVAGNLTLERFTSCTPLRFGTYANFSASVYAGELTINVTVDERHCGIGATTHFAKAIEDSLRRHAELNAT